MIRTFNVVALLALPTLSCFLSGSAVQSQHSSLPSQAGSLDSVACSRPTPPAASWYETRAEYMSAREVYYREATNYISFCIEAWMAEAKVRYNEMYVSEVQGYLDERQSVLDELRRHSTQN